MNKNKTTSSTNKFKEFTFTSTDDVIVVKIFELPGANYGSYVWPCAPMLAQYVWQNKDLVSNQSVLEIGAGTGLPGIVAAKCGARVILSDSVTNTLSHDLCQKSVELNELKNVSITKISWGEVSPRLLALPNIDRILASDCFYHSKDFENVIMTMSFIIHRRPNAIVWCTYQERSSERSIEYLLDKWSLEGKEMNLPNTESLTSSFAAPLKHTIRLFEIKKKNTGTNS